MLENEEINKAFSHYEGKNETELMQELIDLKQSGVIKEGQLCDMAEKIAPMLNPEQRRRLDAILIAFKE